MPVKIYGISILGIAAEVGEIIFPIDRIAFRGLKSLLNFRIIESVLDLFGFSSYIFLMPCAQKCAPCDNLPIDMVIQESIFLIIGKRRWI